MKLVKLLIILTLCVSFISCVGTAGNQNANQPQSNINSNVKAENNSNSSAGNPLENTAQKAETNKSETSSQGKQPRTVRDFFTLLSQKYFALEGCEPQKDKNCEKARAEYVKNYLETEDTANGYWKSGCDGAQMCLEMALFKRADATYIVQVLTMHEMDENSYFLEYKDGNWTDISAKVVPEYSPKNTCVPPRKGTTIEVFKKNYPEPNFSERGAKIYDLTWNDGKFSIKK